MNTMAPEAELQALEKLPDQELEEARTQQNMMLPTEPVCRWRDNCYSRGCDQHDDMAAAVFHCAQ